ncbi:hypothetical protein CTZ27_04330 [Streptomyces griseocarneus]|nr:hypothetical protein CTZ27_04330 [Streptomyces griseocarneus]
MTRHEHAETYTRGPGTSALSQPSSSADAWNAARRASRQRESNTPSTVRSWEFSSGARESSVPLCSTPSSPGRTTDLPGGTTVPAPDPLDPYQTRVAELGTAIRESRLAKGWGQEELATAICMSRPAVSRFESGDRIPHRDTARLIDQALGAGGRIERLRDELDDNPDAKFIQRVFRAERKAVRIRQADGAVPALLQNPEYERAIIQKYLPYFGGSLEDKIKHRALRHEILKRPSPPPFSTVLTEAALHAMVGDQSVMRCQLLDLIAASQRPGIDVRIVPFAGNAEILQIVGEFSIMDLPNGKAAVYAASGVRGFFVTKPSAVAEYIALHDLLQAHALDKDASRDLIRKTVRELYSCTSPNLTGP